MMPSILLSSGPGNAMDTEKCFALFGHV